jgi:hypothetical protein
MAKIEITRPGERIVDDFTALVPQPTTPSTARAPDVGLVELSYVTPTELVPGPPGPPGPAGSRWYTGVGDPTIPGKLGDMYLDDVTGAIWTYNGVAWVMTGTDLSPDASELLLKIKTVDGSGSGLDADTLDGHDSTYFATDADMTAAEAAIDALEADVVNWGEISGIPATFPPTLPIPSSGVVGLDAKQASQDAAIAAIPPFPEAPLDGKTYGRKNATWASVVGGAIVSDTAPAGPQPGQMWYESDSGNTFIWYDDGNSQQWVMQNVLPSGPSLTGTAAISDGPPTNPVNGTLWYESDTGTLFVYYDDGNTRQWVQAGGITGPAPPMDGNEYVMVNGVWRLKAQTFNLAGLAEQIVTVPTWGPSELRFTVVVTGSMAMRMQLSEDGTTFASGAGDYSNSGQSFYTGSATSPAKSTATSANFVLTGTCDHATIPLVSTGIVKLVRFGTDLIGIWGRGDNFSSVATALHQQYVFSGFVQNSVFTSIIRAVRFFANTGSFTFGRLTVEWLP